MLRVYDSRILGLILIPEPCESHILSFCASMKARSEGQDRAETQVSRMVLAPGWSGYPCSPSGLTPGGGN